MQGLKFEYYYGMEADQYSFYRVPKMLFTETCFQSLSCEAKILYGLMLDRMGLSVKNQWFDEKNRVYIIFTVEEIMELLGCGRQKAVRSIAELDGEKGIGLIEKKRMGQGKPNIIYVKNFVIEGCDAGTGDGAVQEDFQKYENQTSGSMKNELPEVPESACQKDGDGISGNEKAGCQQIPVEKQHEYHPIHRKTGRKRCDIQEKEAQRYEKGGSVGMDDGTQERPYVNFQKYENQTSRSMKNGLSEVRKSNGNDTEDNNTDKDRPIISYQSLKRGRGNPAGKKKMDEMEAYRAKIRENIEYDSFAGRSPLEREEVDELVELMVEIMILPDESVVRIAGVNKAAEIVKNRFMKLRFSHVDYILSCLHKNTTKVGNIRAYLLTTLYNATMTMSHYYQAEVNHDLYGGM
ncbi:hypothetical protein B5E53_04515 [Eubacterium sp. An11]|nr:hypothetical protein B5E53_04515 [Eubacterium sp. An11]